MKIFHGHYEKSHELLSEYFITVVRKIDNPGGNHPRWVSSGDNCPRKSYMRCICPGGQLSGGNVL